MDRQRATALERFVVGRRVPGFVGGGDGSTHALQATTLDSMEESLLGFVQQSLFRASLTALGQALTYHYDTSLGKRLCIRF